MKVLVFSDSHGDLEGMEQAVERYGSIADLAFHLGDTLRDARALAQVSPIPLLTVPGNNDYAPDEPSFIVTELAEGVRVLACHGHLYGVNYGLSGLKRAAAEHKVQLVLYGHTHVPAIDFDNGVCYVNPGAAKIGSIHKPTFAVCDIDGGVVRPHIENL